MQQLNEKIAESMKEDIDQEVIYDESGFYLDYLAGLDTDKDILENSLTSSIQEGESDNG